MNSMNEKRVSILVNEQDIADFKFLAKHLRLQRRSFEGVSDLDFIFWEEVENIGRIDRVDKEYISKHGALPDVQQQLKIKD
jgi:hypothetical protein